MPVTSGPGFELAGLKRFELSRELKSSAPARLDVVDDPVDIGFERCVGA